MGGESSTDRKATQLLMEEEEKQKASQNQKSGDEEQDAGVPTSGMEITFLLLGISESGKTTLYKMLKVAFDSEAGPAVLSEKAVALRDIKSFVFKGLQTVLKTMQKESFSFKKLENKETASKFLHLRPETFESNLASLAEKLVEMWDDRGIQQAYAKVEETTPIWNLGYFVEKLPEIVGLVSTTSGNTDENTMTANSDKDHYNFILTDRDLSRIEQPTTTITTQKVTVRGLYTCRVVDVGGLRQERTTKWAQCFRDTTAVMYVVDSSAFDICLTEEPSKNRLLEALECFELLVSNRWLQGISFILFLNKQDVLLEKICVRKKKISSKHTGFVGYSSYELEDDEEKDIEKTAKSLDYPVDDVAEYIRTRAFIKHMFETVFESVRDLSRISKDSATEKIAVFRATSPPSVFYRMNRPYQSNLRGECYSYYTVAVEPDSLTKIFPDAVTCILKEYIHNAKLF